MKITVVGLGKIGLPLAVQFAGQGHRVVGADIDRRVVRAVREARPPFPGEAHLDERLARGGRPRAPSRRRRTPPRPSRRATPSWSSCRSTSTRSARRSSPRSTRPPQAVGRGLRPGTLVTYETTLPVGTTRTRLAPMLASGQRPAAGGGLLPRLQPGAGLVRARLRRPRALPEAGRRPRPAERAAGRRLLRGRAAVRRAPGSRPSRTACGTSARPRRRSWPSWPRPPTGTSTSASPTSSRCTPTASASTSPGWRRRATRSRSATCTSPGIAVGGHCIPVYPWLYLGGDPAATIVRAAREANRTMPERCVDRARGGVRGPDRRRGRRPRRLLPGRGQGDRLLRGLRHGRRAAPARCGRRWCTTRCTPRRSSSPSGSIRTCPGGGWTPPWCRPTTPSTPGCRRPTSPACASCWTAATCSTPSAGKGSPSSGLAGAGVTARRGRCRRRHPAVAGCPRCPSRGHLPASRRRCRGSWAAAGSPRCRRAGSSRTTGPR